MSLIVLKRVDGACLKAETSLSSIKQKAAKTKKKTLCMKRNPGEGFQRKQKDLSSFPFSTSVKSDSESPIRAAGLQNKFNEKASPQTRQFLSTGRIERQEDTNEQLFRLCSRLLPVCLCSLKCFFLQLRSIQPLWKRAFFLLCLVDDFGGELMKGDAEGRKQQMRRNKDQSGVF